MKTYPKLEKRAKLVLAELNVIPKIVRGCGLITIKTMKLNINICGTSDGDFLWVNIFPIFNYFSLISMILIEERKHFVLVS